MRKPLVHKHVALVRSKLKGNESGVTLVELLIAMGILTILMVISMAAIVSMSKSTVRVQAVADSTDQLRVLFQRLDKEVRYASAINMPVVVNESQYVEYLVDAPAGGGAAQCIQWRYVPNTSEVQRREWPLDTADVTDWSTVVTDVRNDLTDPDQVPFRLIPIENNDGRIYSRQQLEVYVDSGLGEERDKRGGQLDVSFTAQNSSKSSPNSVCMSTGVGRS